jgi:hypothetical protein
MEAEAAVTVDTTGRTITDIVDELEAMVRERTVGASGGATD